MRTEPAPTTNRKPRRTFVVRRAAFLVLATAAASLAGLFAAGSASAWPGYYAAAVVSCQANSQTLTMTASADAQPGFDIQAIAAQFYFTNLDTGASYFAPGPTQNDWATFFNQVTRVQVGISSTALQSNPGSVTRSYTVPRGHYVVWVKYMWLDDRQLRWSNPTGWIKSVNSYEYTDSPRGIIYEFGNSCPVGIPAW